MEKQDLTSYSDQELSLQFENTEGLYQDLMYWTKRNEFQPLKEIAELYFIFTAEQLADLFDTFNLEVEELNG